MTGLCSSLPARRSPKVLELFKLFFLLCGVSSLMSSFGWVMSSLFSTRNFLWDGVPLLLDQISLQRGIQFIYIQVIFLAAPGPWTKSVLVFVSLMLPFSFWLYWNICMPYRYTIVGVLSQLHQKDWRQCGIPGKPAVFTRFGQHIFRFPNIVISSLFLQGDHVPRLDQEDPDWGRGGASMQCLTHANLWSVNSKAIVYCQKKSLQVKKTEDLFDDFFFLNSPPSPTPICNK